MSDDLLEKSASAVEHSEAANSDQPAEKPFKWTFNVMANLGALYMIIFTSSWAQGVPASAIAFIAARFPDEAGLASWTATSSSVTAAVTVAVVGHMSDALDRRSFLLFGCAVGCAGMLVAGLATSLTMVICGQVLTGLGMGCGFPSNPLAQEIVPKTHRPVAVGFSTLCTSASFIGAPIIEGVFIQRGVGGALDGWRAGFYVGAGLNALTFCRGVACRHTPSPAGFQISATNGVETKRREHSFMHDLEPFFWVLFWICIHCDGPVEGTVVAQS